MRSSAFVALLIGSSLLSSTLIGCTNKDAGDVAWVRQVVPAVLGRPAYNMAEVQALVSIAQTHGRGAVVDALMQSPDFRSYWKQVVLDDLEIGRQVGVPISPEHADCYEDERLLTTPAAIDTYADALVDFISYGPITGDFCTYDPGSSDPSTLRVHTSASREDVQAMETETAETARQDALLAKVEPKGATPRVPPDNDWLSADAMEEAGYSADPVVQMAELQAEEEAAARAETAKSDSAKSDDTTRASAETATTDAATATAEAQTERTDKAEEARKDAAWDTSEYEDVDTGLASDAAGADAATADGQKQIKDQDPIEVPCGPFNMADVITAGIEKDNLSVVWIANLASMASAETPQGFSAEFGRTYTNRDTSCMSCHTSSYSTTNARPANNWWDRHFPLFDTSTGRPLDLDEGFFTWYATDASGFTLKDASAGFVNESLTETSQRAIENFVTGKLGDTSNGALAYAPWGMADTCTDYSRTYTGSDGLLHTQIRQNFKTDLTGTTVAGIAGMVASSNAGPATLIDLLRYGFLNLQNPWMLDHGPNQPTASGGADLTTNQGGLGCTGCHNGGTTQYDAPDLATVAPSISRVKLQQILVHGSGSGLMSAPLSGTSNAEIAQRKAVADTLKFMGSGADNDSLDVHSARSADLGHLVAAQITESVFAELSGAHLTLAHGYSRNYGQALLLSGYTEDFIQSGYSLRALVKELVLSDGFNREAPSEDTRSQAYDLPQVFNPWSESHANGCGSSDPNDVAECNSVGDTVHRYSVANRMHSLSRVLYDTTPGAFRSSGYWSAGAQGSYGRYVSAVLPERTELDFSSLLNWDKNLNQCAANAFGTDFPSELLVWANGQHTFGEVFMALKMRLLNNPYRASDEEAAQLAYLQGMVTNNAAITLSTPVNSANSLHQKAVRGFCGVLISTPQFLLAGMAADVPDGATWSYPDTPGTSAWVLADAPCLSTDDPACTYSDWCSYWTDLAGATSPLCQ